MNSWKNKMKIKYDNFFSLTLFLKKIYFKTIILIGQLRLKPFDYFLINASVILIFIISYYSFIASKNPQAFLENLFLNFNPKLSAEISTLTETPELVINITKEIDPLIATDENSLSSSKYDKTTLQGFTAADCSQLPVCVYGSEDCDTNGSTITLTDIRDNKQYRIRRFELGEEIDDPEKHDYKLQISSGRCWMIDNLNYQYQDSIDAGDNYGQLYSYESLTKNLCPDNWHLSGDIGKEIYAIMAKITLKNSKETNFYEIINDDEAKTKSQAIKDFLFSPNYFNGLLAGMTDSENTIHNQGQVGHLWSIEEESYNNNGIFIPARISTYLFTKKEFFQYNQYYYHGFSPFDSFYTRSSDSILKIGNKYSVRCYQSF